MNSDNTFNASSKTLDELKNWLNSTRPSTNEGTIDGWYWIMAKNVEPQVSSGDEEKQLEFMTSGERLVDILVKECARIKETAPVRGNKKQGIESQKDLREKAYNVFNHDVKELSIKTSLLSGKWLLYPTPENVDTTWAKIAKGYLDGAALVQAGSSSAKVSCALGDSKVYVICVYSHDSFDKVKVKKLLDSLIKDCGVLPSSYKCDANTMLNIDSNHVSGIKSSLYTPSHFYTKEEISSMFQPVAPVPTKSSQDVNNGLEIGTASSSEDDGPKAKRQKK